MFLSRLSTRIFSPVANFASFRHSKTFTTKVHSLSEKVLKKISESENQDPLEKGYEFLVSSCNARYCFQPFASSNQQFIPSIKTPFPEIFDTALILDLLIKKPFCSTTIDTALRYLSKNQNDDKLFSFFEDPDLLPPDVDDTSLVWLVLLKMNKRTFQEAQEVVNKIMANIDEKGCIQTYFPPQYGREERVDPSVCANALRLIYHLGASRDCKATEDYLYSYLEKMSPSSVDENLYYGNQTFFYFMGEAIKSSQTLKERFESLFIDRVRACIGSSLTPIDLATRVIISNEWGFSNQMEAEKLALLQKLDGSWPIDVAYTGSRKNLFWGSPSISTAFALRALDHEKVISERKETFSLPIFNQGFELNGGLLRYSESFEVFNFNYTTLGITHTETLSGLVSKFYDPDYASLANALTEKGQRDARALGRRLKDEIGEKPVLIFHADNMRTFQTALAIREEIPQATLESVHWLREIHCGEWLGQDTAKILQTSFSACSMFHHSNCLAYPKDGESFLKFLNKIYLGLKEIRNKEVTKNTTLLLCTSRVNLVAFKILTKRDIDYTSKSHIHWAQMARKIKAGTVFQLS